MRNFSPTGLSSRNQPRLPPQSERKIRKDQLSRSCTCWHDFFPDGLLRSWEPQFTLGYLPGPILVHYHLKLASTMWEKESVFHQRSCSWQKIIIFWRLVTEVIVAQHRGIILVRRELHKGKESYRTMSLRWLGHQLGSQLAQCLNFKSHDERCVRFVTFTCMLIEVSPKISMTNGRRNSGKNSSGKSS